MKILDRYIVSEMAGPFLFGLSAFVLLFFSAETLMGVARLVLESKASGFLILEYLAWRLPQVLVLTLPMAVLLASLLSFGRLSGESELTALKAGGVGLLRVAIPGLAFCAAMSLVSLALNQQIVPQGMKRAYDILLQVQEPSEFQKAIITSPYPIRDNLEMMLYAHYLIPRKQEIQGLFIHYFTHGRRVRDIYAEVARWNGKVWVLKNVYMSEYDLAGKQLVESKSLQGWMELPAGWSPAGPDTLAQRDLRPEEMDTPALRAQIGKIAQIWRPDDPDLNRRYRRLQVNLHQRFALPLACLTFGAFGIPLALRSHRTGTSMGIGLSLLFILFYYVLMSGGVVLAETGALPVQVGAWIPNLVFGVVGVFLLIRASSQ